MMERQNRTEPGYCILCGAEASSFGSQTVAAGWLCGGCIGKMSPWFRLRQDVTETELCAHLAYRDENKTRSPAFHPTVRLWRNPTLYMDDVRRQFAVSDALTKEFPTENPDILEYRQILQCDMEIEESRTEWKKFSPRLGKISYRPKRYNYGSEALQRGDPLQREKGCSDTLTADCPLKLREKSGRNARNARF